MAAHGRTWAVVLAGGSGNRLASLTTGEDGVQVPKQFCSFGGPQSMLQRTLGRTQRIVPASRIVPVVVEGHRRWWQHQLNGIPAGNILVQPRNHGTGAAVLHALLTILDRDRDATLLIIPSDHGVEDEAVLHEATVSLLEEARHSPGRLVLLGSEPEAAETSYGWIVRKENGRDRACGVARFVEKPAAREATALLRAGALWNTLICASTAYALALIYAESELHWPMHVRNASPVPATDDDLAFQARKESLQLDFSKHVLSARADRLRVLSLPSCGWSDLGTPERMRAWMRRRELKTVPGLRDVHARPKLVPAGDHSVRRTKPRHFDRSRGIHSPTRAGRS
jgi:mannose-1-phosphate guanylyltransferase